MWTTFFACGEGGGTDAALNEFVLDVNSRYQSIRITVEEGGSKINFLDLCMLGRMVTNSPFTERIQLLTGTLMHHLFVTLAKKKNRTCGSLIVWSLFP